MVNYYLLENMLTERQNDYSAHTHVAASFDKEAIIARMLNRGTLLTRTDILAVLNGLEETIAAVLLEGNSVTLPLFNISFSISGVFDGPLDVFDRHRHKLNINLTKGVMLREVEQKMKLEKVNASAPQPNIQEVKDSVSGTVNEKLTSKGVAELRGFNLKVEGDNPDCGVWFSINGQDFKSAVLIENKPSKIIAIIPELPAGECRVKVATQFSGGGAPLKAPRQAVFSKTLVVVT